MHSHDTTPGLRVVLIMVGMILGAMIVLGAVSQGLTHELNDALFAETGPFEEMSPWLWLLLGAAILVTFRRPTLPVLAGVVLSIACAAREWDMHKSFTGYSVLKPAFYLRSEYELHHQLIAGLAVAILGVSTFVVVRHFLRVRPRGWKPLPMWLLAMIVGAGMLVFTKVLDRSPKIFSGDFGIELPEPLLSLMMAWEEGLESMLPVAFGAMVLSYAALKRASLSDASKSRDL